MSLFNSNVDDYSIYELMTMVGVNNLTQEEIVYKTNAKIYESNNDDVVFFYSQIRNKLLAEISNPGIHDELELFELSDDSSIEEEDNIEREGFENINNDDNDEEFEDPMSPNGHNADDLTVDPPAAEQTHMYELPIVQGNINPNLKNTISRFVNLDSQFRQFSNNKHSSSNYSLDLSNTLSNVLSLRLYSYEIPFMWYTFDQQLNNTCLRVAITVPNSSPSIQETFAVVISDGNYSPDDFVIELNRAFQETFTDPSNSLSPIVSYNKNNGKITISLLGWTAEKNSVIYTVDTTSQLVFFDVNGLNCYLGKCDRPTANYLNQTLGWYMGFRDADIYASSTNIGESIADFIGTKYIMLVVDDFNQNHVSNGLVSISEPANIVNMPNYYSRDMVNTCLPPVLIPDPTINVATTIMMGNPVVEYNRTPQVTAASIAASTNYPRSLTSAQIYTINEIHKNRNNNTNLKARAPTTPGILAMIPLKRTTFTMGTMLTDFSGSLQESDRTYFGPVNIERLHIKLIDDKGNLLNLNGGDWCVTLIATCLYQY